MIKGLPLRIVLLENIFYTQKISGLFILCTCMCYKMYVLSNKEIELSLRNERSCVIGSIWCLWNQSIRSQTFNSDFCLELCRGTTSQYLDLWRRSVIGLMFSYTNTRIIILFWFRQPYRYEILQISLFLVCKYWLTDS